jgi:hypothetical protein
MTNNETLRGVREYSKGLSVQLREREGRPVLAVPVDLSFAVVIDLPDLIKRLRENRPELFSADRP